jgi:hypothetical protein
MRACQLNLLEVNANSPEPGGATSRSPLSPSPPDDEGGRSICSDGDCRLGLCRRSFRFKHRWVKRGSSMCLPCGRCLSRRGSQVSILHRRHIHVKPAYSGVRAPSPPTTSYLSVVVPSRIQYSFLTLKCGTKIGTFFSFLQARKSRYKSSRLNTMSPGISVSWPTFLDSMVACPTDTLGHTESPFLHSSTFTSVPFASDGPPISQLPVLTSFIPSLFQNAPFRVSIHSWEKPKPSRMMESLVGPHDAILFEARVYIDGVLVACVPPR